MRELKIKKLETDSVIRLHQLELQKGKAGTSEISSNSGEWSSSDSADTFGVSKNMPLVLVF